MWWHSVLVRGISCFWSVNPLCPVLLLFGEAASYIFVEGFHFFTSERVNFPFCFWAEKCRAERWPKYVCRKHFTVCLLVCHKKDNKQLTRRGSSSLVLSYSAVVRMPLKLMAQHEVCHYPDSPENMINCCCFALLMTVTHGSSLLNWSTAWRPF